MGAIRRVFGHRVACNAHHVVAIPVAVRCMNSLPGGPGTAGSSDRVSTRLMTFTSGFFLYDLAAWFPDPVMTFHALGGGALYWYSMASGKLHRTSASHVLWEISTPFVHAREWLTLTGRKNTRLYKINGVVMMVAFFAFRNYGGAVMLRAALRDSLGVVRPGPREALRLVSVAMNALNAFWFSKMLRGAVRLFVLKSH